MGYSNSSRLFDWYLMVNLGGSGMSRYPPIIPMVIDWVILYSGLAIIWLIWEVMMLLVLGVIAIWM